VNLKAENGNPLEPKLFYREHSQPRHRRTAGGAAGDLGADDAAVTLSGVERGSGGRNVGMRSSAMYTSRRVGGALSCGPGGGPGGGVRGGIGVGGGGGGGGGEG